ncbi:MAG TPA: hypothetical protein PKD26_05070 [Pyrinomonadaceae bacterium]|nr:hypothetical protein [Pyrinomonadaceae bacterium]
MRSAVKLGFVAFLLVFFLDSVSAQRRTPTPRPTKPAVVTTNTLPPSNLQADAKKVSNQVMNVTRFLYLLGGIAKGIEDIDKDPRANQAARNQNAENKKTVVQTIRNLRAGLAALEVEFRTKPLLRKYLLNIEGVAGLTGEAEDLALAGKFSDAGRPLVSVVEKLADTLAVMP